MFNLIKLILILLCVESFIYKYTYYEIYFIVSFIFRVLNKKIEKENILESLTFSYLI